MTILETLRFGTKFNDHNYAQISMNKLKAAIYFLGMGVAPWENIDELMKDYPDWKEKYESEYN